jgi:hypothetical protein
MGIRVNYIDKQEFIPLYQQARIETLYERNIRSGFAASGLDLYEPDRVISLLHALIHILSP